MKRGEKRDGKKGRRWMREVNEKSKV